MNKKLIKSLFLIEFFKKMSTSFLKLLTITLVITNLTLVNEPSATENTINSIKISDLNKISETELELKEKFKRSLEKLIRQENLVNRELLAGKDRLDQSCKLLQKHTDKLQPQNLSTLQKIEQQFENNSKNARLRKDELQKELKEQKEVIGILESKDCKKLAFNNSRECKLIKFKKESLLLIEISSSAYYKLIEDRNIIYKGLLENSKNNCSKIEFIEKILKADEEYLIVYEINSNKLFTNLINNLKNID